MANTTDREVAHKHRVKKKTLEDLYKKGRLPKSLYHRIGL
jgi:hypothetical protein